MKKTKKLRAVRAVEAPTVAEKLPEPPPPEKPIGQITVTKWANGNCNVELGGDNNLLTGLSLARYAELYFETGILQRMTAPPMVAPAPTKPVTP